MTYYRRRVSPIKPGEPIDYKDVDLLRKFITERGKILPSHNVLAEMMRRVKR